MTIQSGMETASQKDNKILFVSLSLITVTFVLFLAFDCRMTLVEEYKVSFTSYNCNKPYLFE